MRARTLRAGHCTSGVQSCLFVFAPFFMAAAREGTGACGLFRMLRADLSMEEGCASFRRGRLGLLRHGEVEAMEKEFFSFVA